MNGKLTSVAAIGMGGFIAESAPVLIEGKRPNRTIWILLTDTQRTKLERWAKIRHDDMHYQGKFPGALPQGWEVLHQTGDRRKQSWINASNQWFDAQELAVYIQNRDCQDTNGMELLKNIIDAAAAL